MPPANTPTPGSPHLAVSQATTRTPSPSPLLPMLRELSSDVLDLASTLTTPAEADIDSQNLTFLRSPPEPVAVVDAEAAALSVRAASRELRNDLRRQQLQQRERTYSQEAREARLLRDQYIRTQFNTHENWAESMRARTSSSHVPYGDQVPGQQSLYDWAPGQEELEDPELEELLATLQQQQPNAHPGILRVLARAQMDSERELQRGVTNRSHPSLRSAAILQSVRRNRQLSARSRDLMHRYVVERDRTRTEAEQQPSLRDPAEASSQPPSATSVPADPRYEQSRLAWQASERNSTRQTTHTPRNGENLDTLRRRYLEDPTSSPSKFESVIKLLHSLRSQDEPEKSVYETMLNVRAKSRTDVSSLEGRGSSSISLASPPTPCSWLAPGVVFSGRQQAAPVTSSGTTLYRLANSQGLSSVSLREGIANAGTSSPARAIPQYQALPQEPESAASLASRSDQRARAASVSPGTRCVLPSLRQDQWTVKVVLHAVDYEKMTLQGTMEAYNVPSFPSQSQRLTHPSRETPEDNKTTFSTYLEGEMIDFVKNTLQTDSFKSSPDVDATYWRKLEPFAKLTDENIAAALLDPQWVQRELTEKYVLMRWKERCFVRDTLSTVSGSMPPSVRARATSSNSASTAQSHETSHRGASMSATEVAEIANGETADTGNGFGLSISGFYYVSLRRSDGRCEGLYFEPQSSPYQHLDLKPETGGIWSCGASEFR